jgi:hypothetical protein
MNITPEALLASLAGSERKTAWHSLVESGPDVQLIALAFRAANPEVQVLLLRALREWRTPECFPLAELALQAAETQVWKEALDVLVTIGGIQSANALRKSLMASSGSKREWIEEALQQVTHSVKRPG